MSLEEELIKRGFKKKEKNVYVTDHVTIYEEKLEDNVEYWIEVSIITEYYVERSLYVKYVYKNDERVVAEPLVRGRFNCYYHKRYWRIFLEEINNAMDRIKNKKQYYAYDDLVNRLLNWKNDIIRYELAKEIYGNGIDIKADINEKYLDSEYRRILNVDVIIDKMKYSFEVPINEVFSSKEITVFLIKNKKMKEVIQKTKEIKKMLQEIVSEKVLIHNL